MRQFMLIAVIINACPSLSGSNCRQQIRKLRDFLIHTSASQKRIGLELDLRVNVSPNNFFLLYQYYLSRQRFRTKILIIRLCGALCVRIK